MPRPGGIRVVEVPVQPQLAQPPISPKRLSTRENLYLYSDPLDVAYYGLNWGGWRGPISAAVKPHVKMAILLSGGLLLRRHPADGDPVNFAPHVTVPVLMLNNRNDHIFPLEAAQESPYQLLGTPPKGERHIVHESGHVPPRQAVTKDMLDWLDKYLGPVQTK